jgi:glycosyltransferase involved in cell wall biosynthesis
MSQKKEILPKLKQRRTMKRILLAIGSSEIGGGQKIFLTCIREFLKRNCSIVVVLPNGPLVEIVKSFNVKIYIVNFNSITALIKIAMILHREKVDIVNTYLTKCSFLFSLVNIFFRVPLCCTLLNAITHEKLGNLQKRVYPFIYFLLQKLCDGIIVNSGQNKKHFIDVAKINDNLIKVIYSGIDIDEFQGFQNQKPRDHKFVIGAVGRLSPEKGHIYLIKALTHITNIDFECIFVGDGPLLAELENYVKELNLDSRIKFLGFQANVARIMYQMDVVIMPSLNETFGITIVEAFALKKIVIASDAGGIPELVINNKTGLLFPAKDSSALAEKILYVYNNKEEAHTMAMNGYEYFKKNFTSSIMAENTITYYNTLTTHKRAISDKV